MLLFCLFSISEVYQVLSNLWTITCGVGIACISHYNNAKSCILLVQARLTSRPRTQDALVLVGATAALVVLSSSVSAYISVYIAFSFCSESVFNSFPFYFNIKHKTACMDPNKILETVSTRWT